MEDIKRIVFDNIYAWLNDEMNINTYVISFYHKHFKISNTIPTPNNILAMFLTEIQCIIMEMSEKETLKYRQLFFDNSDMYIDEKIENMIKDVARDVYCYIECDTQMMNNIIEKVKELSYNLGYSITVDKNVITDCQICLIEEMSFNNILSIGNGIYKYLENRGGVLLGI